MGRKRNKKGAKDVGRAAEVTIAAAVRKVRDILSEHSEEEIRATLLQCNLNHYEAMQRLLSEQDASNKQGTSTQLTDSSTTTTASVLVPNQSDLPNLEIRDVPVPVSSGQVVPPLSVPSSSDVANGVTRSVPTSLNPSLSVPSSRAPTNVKTKRQASRIISASDPSWADVFRGLHKKPDATNGSYNSLTEESDAARKDHRQESALYQQPNRSEPNPQHSAFPVTQPMDTRQQSIATTASSLGTDVNSFFSSTEFQQRGGGGSSNSNTLAHHGNMMSSHYTWLEPDDTSIYQSLDSVFAPYRNSTLSLSATSSVPTYHDSAYGVSMLSGNSRLGCEYVSGNHLPSNSSGGTSTAYSRPWSGSIPRVHLPSNSSGISRVPSSHGSDYGRGMSSGNGSNSRLGYGNVSRNHLPSNSSGTSFIGPSSHVNGSNSRLGYGDYLPPVHHQGRRPFEWRVEGEDSYRSIAPRSQQEREAYFERIRADLASSSLDQEYNTSYPSDHTQQRPPRDK